MEDRTCSVEGCERTGKLRRGWCGAHYWRWRMYGDPLGTKNRESQPSRKCSVDDCGRKHFGHGFCNLHYYRWRKNGDPNIALKAWGRRNKPPGYIHQHFKTRQERGSAELQECEHCGEQARDWAYDHGDPNEVIDGSRGLAYSLDVNHYIPLCKPCHWRFDDAYRAGSR